MDDIYTQDIYMDDTYTQDVYMDDIYMQDIAHVDQPAELEGIQLNWGPSIFTDTPNGPYDLRTATATPEFWDLWHRNQEALKAAGIFYAREPEGLEVQWWINVSDPTDGTQEDNICIPKNKYHTLSEVIDLVKQTLEGVSERSAQNRLRYSSIDVYWLLHDMLRYVSHNASGVFVLRQIQKDTYRVKHMAEDFAKQRSGRKLKAEVNRTAKYLEELTGRRPSWGEEEEQ